MVSYLVAIYAHDLVFILAQACSLLVSQWNLWLVTVPNIRFMIGAPVKRMKLPQLLANHQVSQKTMKGKVRSCHGDHWNM